MKGFDHRDALLVGDQETLDAKVNEGKALLRQYTNGGTGTLQGMRAPMTSSESIELTESQSWNKSIV